MRVLVDSILRLSRVPAAGYNLRLTSSYGSIEFRRLDTSCGWFHPLVDSSSGGWIQVSIDSILRLNRVPIAGHKLPLSPSNSWLEFRWLDTSYSWLHPTNDSNSGAWTQLKADFFLRLTKSYGWLRFWRLEMSYSWFHPVADPILRLTRVPPAELDLGMTYTLIYQVNLRTYSANRITFMVCFQAHDFSYQWFRRWLLLQEPWRSSKNFEEAWRNFKTKAIIIIVKLLTGNMNLKQTKKKKERTKKGGLLSSYLKPTLCKNILAKPHRQFLIVFFS